MQSIDLNLLVALPALLREQSVTGAARRGCRPCYSALFGAAASDLIAAVPACLAASGVAAFGVHAFPLPVEGQGEGI